MLGIQFEGPGTHREESEAFARVRAALVLPPAYHRDNVVADHLLQAMWWPALLMSQKKHINLATQRGFGCFSYYADSPDLIAFCTAQDEVHLATIGTSFIWRLVKVCHRMDAVLRRRPSLNPGPGSVERDPELRALIAGESEVSESEAIEIVSAWPAAGKEGQQIELGPYALFYDLVRLVWLHEWAHALTGHVRFAARDLQLSGVDEFSVGRTNSRLTGEGEPPAHEVFQAMELHADEFAARYLTYEVVFGYDPVGHLAGPRVNLVDRLVIFNMAFVVFATMWWLEERKYTPEQSFYPERKPPTSNEPDPLFQTFRTTHPPAALRYMRFRDFQRDVTTLASAQYGDMLAPSVDAASYGFLSGVLTDVDPDFSVLLEVTPMVAMSPTMKRLVAYEQHLLDLSGFLASRIVDLGYTPTEDPAGDAVAFQRRGRLASHLGMLRALHAIVDKEKPGPDSTGR